MRSGVGTPVGPKFQESAAMLAGSEPTVVGPTPVGHGEGEAGMRLVWGERISEAWDLNLLALAGLLTAAKQSRCRAEGAASRLAEPTAYAFSGSPRSTPINGVLEDPRDARIPEIASVPLTLAKARSKP